MLKFIEANLGNTQGSLKNVLRTCHTEEVDIPRLSPNGICGLVTRWRKTWLSNLAPPMNMSLGWIVSRLAASGHKVYWHNGATGGYRAFVGFVKESNTGIVVLTNRGLSPYDLFFRVLCVEDIGFHMLKFIQ